MELQKDGKWNATLFYDIDYEQEVGVVTTIAYFFVVVATLRNPTVYEIVRVGVNQLIGEIVRVERDTATIWMYESISGLQVGDPVVRTRQALSVELGPGLIGQMYDGLQRPFQEMCDGGTKLFLSQGTNLPALDRHKQWEFIPQNFKIGDHITGGDVFGKVYETNMVVHWIMLPPKASGTITYIALAGHYTVTEEVLTIESKEGDSQSFSMMHKWPARTPRPFAEKTRSYTPVYTGQRVIDAFYPLAQGGSCVIPGAFGTGKGVLCQNVVKYSDSDVVVYVGCGERGNELAEMVDLSSANFYEGTKYDIMRRTCIVGNTSNMPMGAREPCIYAGITISEYFRDQGHNATVVVDNISRWLEVLNVFGICTPNYSVGDYYLNSRIARIYERAGKVKCLGSRGREGSLSIVSTVSAPGGDLGDAGVNGTLSSCNVMWLLDKKLAQRRSFPAFNIPASHSSYNRKLTPFYTDFDENYESIVAKTKNILMTANDLDEIVQLVGMDALAESDKLVLKVAELIQQDFIQQDIATKEDRECPVYKTVWMMKNIVTFHDLAKQATERDVPLRNLMGHMGSVWHALRNMKYEDPAQGRTKVEKHMKEVHNKIAIAFCAYDDIYET